MSAGVVVDHKPSIGLVKVMDGKTGLYNTGVNGEVGAFCGVKPHKDWYTGVQPLDNAIFGIDDCRAVDDSFRLMVNNKILDCAAYAQIMPSVYGGISVLRGEVAFYITSNGWNWDYAAIAALCTAAGMTVLNLDGSEVDWRRTRPQLPVVFAQNRETFDFVKEIGRDWLELQAQKKSDTVA